MVSFSTKCMSNSHCGEKKNFMFNHKFMVRPKEIKNYSSPLSPLCLALPRTHNGWCWRHRRDLTKEAASQVDEGALGEGLPPPADLAAGSSSLAIITNLGPGSARSRHFLELSTKRRVPDFARSGQHTARSSGGKYEFHGIGGGDEQCELGTGGIGAWCKQDVGPWWERTQGEFGVVGLFF